MAYTTINKSTNFFSPKTYTGNGTAIGSGGNAITGVGFQPDLVWIKSRTEAEKHMAFDAPRGVTKAIKPSETATEATNAEFLTAFGSDGFTVGNHDKVNTNAKNYISWNWKANGAGSSNTDGSINSTVSVNSTAGFSIVKYSGDPNANTTIGHGLGAIPKLIITKCITTTHNWGVYHHSLGVDKYLRLNTTDSEQSSSGAWGSTPTSSVFGVGGLNENDQASQDYIAYCFSDVSGYSKFGSYVGNGNADGTFVYTGFKPTFVMTKRTDSTGYWQICDTARDVDNVAHNFLFANDSGSESSTVGNTQYDTDILSNGFKIRTTLASRNTDGADFIYMAFGQSIVGSNNIPATAR